MKRHPVTSLRRALLALAALALPVLPLHAQDSGIEDRLTLAQAEHVAADLKPGMSTNDVQRLLGVPRRTALKSEGETSAKSARRTLQWTYTWKNSTVLGSLRVDFASKATDDWTVASWDWVNF